MDGTLEKKEMGSLVEIYVWKLKVIEFLTDKWCCPLFRYDGIMSCPEEKHQQ